MVVICHIDDVLFCITRTAAPILMMRCRHPAISAPSPCLLQHFPLKRLMSLRFHVALMWLQAYIPEV